MGENITWETELASALAKAKSGGKPVLLDFYNPQ
jgi:thiol:disulfide interchange protein